VGGVKWRVWMVATVAVCRLTACMPWRMAYLRDTVNRATPDEITPVSAHRTRPEHSPTASRRRRRSASASLRGARQSLGPAIPNRPPGEPQAEPPVAGRRSISPTQHGRRDLDGCRCGMPIVCWWIVALVGRGPPCAGVTAHLLPLSARYAPRLGSAVNCLLRSGLRWAESAMWL
jgi:hypothetical protein